MRIFSVDDFDQVAIDSPFSAALEMDPKLSFSTLSEPALQAFSAAAAITNFSYANFFGGHYYSLATSVGITRAAAMAEAEASTFTGATIEYAIPQTYQGYLVTITSADEEAFIEGFIKSANGGNYFASEPGALWIGGEYWASAWRWATGPEAAEAMAYTHWLGTESAQGLTEPYAVMNMYAAYIGGNNWQSVSSDFTSGIRGYVIEYREITPPVVMTFSTADGASNTSISSNITLTFSETIFKGTGFIEIRSGSENGPLVERFDVAASSALTFSGATLVIDPSVTLKNSTHYFVTIGSTAIQDAVGNKYIGGSAYDFSTEAAIITGTDGPDVLTGTSAGEQIDGLASNDTIYGLDGNDTITGGDGSDTIYGGAGDDVITGQLFNLNTAVGSGSGQINGVNYYISLPDNIYGDIGNDTIYFSGGNCYGELGNDNIYNKLPDNLIDIGIYQKQKSYIYGGEGNDTIISDNLWSGITRFGNFESHYTISKILFGIEELKLISSSYIDGGDGNNIISGGFNDEIYTGSGNDYINAYDPKYIESGGGNDTIVIAHFDARNYYHISGRNFNFPNVYESPLSAILDNTNFNTIVNAGAGDDRIEIGEFLFQVSHIDGGDGRDEVVFKNYFGVLNLSDYDGKFSNIEVFTSATSITEFNGRAIDDFLVGSDAGEIIRGLGGNDQIYGKGGNDYIEGNEGDDLLAGEDGNDTLLGGDGNDHLEGGAGNDSLYGGFGNDQIYSGSGNDIVYAGDGNDTVYGDVGDDQINGDAGDDFLRGNDGNDYLGGGDGNDILDGGTGNDGLAGGDGNDILYGAEGDDTLLGQGGDDLFYGGAGRDYMVGGDGVDKIFGGDGDDVIGGEVGNDEILGEAGAD